MFEVFFSHILEKVTLTENEKEQIKTYFEPSTLLKKELLLKEGEVCNYFSFVEKGILKSYQIDDKGVEHILFFAMEGWWTSDMHSFFTGDTAVINIEALEDASLLMISLADFEKMTLEIPVMDRYFRILFQNSLFTKERRLMSSITHTAEEKYLEITEKNPELLQRVPQQSIASYLGITPQTLSRVKKRVLKRVNRD